MGVTFQLLQDKKPCNAFGIFLYGRFVCSLPLIYLFIYVYQYTLTDFFVMFLVIVQYSVIHFIAQSLPALTSGGSFLWLLLLLLQISSILCFWHYKVLQVHFVYSLLQPWNQHFSKELQFLVLENDIRNQEKAERYVFCHFCASLLHNSQDKPRQIYECILTHVYTKCVSICNHLCVHIYINLSVYSY